MRLASPEHINIRLDSEQWIGNEADRTYFNQLVAAIRGMARDGERLLIPGVEEPFAWRRAYALFSALKKRAPTRMKGGSGFVGAGDADLAWEGYVRNLDEIRKLARNDVGGWSLLSEYVGIERGDLDDPVPPPDHPEHQWRRYSDWQHRAGRISSALSQLRSMGPRERAMVPEIVSQRRRDRMIEQRFTALEQKVLALESRLPSVQELLLKEEETNYGQ
jgi:hypothetical protein